MEYPGEPSRATFVVRVTEETGGSWRGDMAEVAQRKLHRFSNVQELLGLMETAIEERNPNEE